ncbi:MAG: hypothetical protein EOP47_23075 [Sphingobacteriaceae bacterium]|nr:MAG: hypothetical protein EOP47_23075 [Sphingobacteriaceae bacterium]
MDFNQNTMHPAKTFKSLTIIHLALLAGQAIFVVVTLAATHNKFYNSNYTGDAFYFIVPVMAVIGLAASGLLFKQQLAKAKQAETVSAKLAVYTTASIIKFALMEAPALFGIVVFFITGNLYYLVFPGLLMLSFLMQRPGKQRVTEQLELSATEAMELDN